jgi:hypothetical protein
LLNQNFFILIYIINKMSQFDFDYEFYFTNDFDANVILQSDAPDKSQAFQDYINSKIQEIKIVLNLHGGVHKLSTFHEENSVIYKVTLEKIQ